jgi:hypothetical protein
VDQFTDKLTRDLSIDSMSTQMQIIGPFHEFVIELKFIASSVLTF